MGDKVLEGFRRFVGDLQCEIGAGMKEKTFMDRVVMVLGFLVGILIWFWGFVISLLRSLWQTINGESVAGPGTQAMSRIDDVGSSDANTSSRLAREDGVIQSEEEDDTEPFAIEPDPAAGVDTVVQGLGVSHLDSTHQQHGELGGIPEDSASGEAATSEDADPTASQGLGAASAFSYSGTPYDADLTEDGTPLNYRDETDRQEDVPLDEGIPNLGEPGDVEDTGPDLASDEVSIEEVEDDVPENYRSGDDLESVNNDEPWEAETPEDDDIPAASRGYREYGEEDTDEESGEDYSADDELEYEASGTGEESDLENDEAPAWDSADFSIVDDPDEPLSADELDTPLDVSVGDEDSLESGSGHLGMSGDFEQVDATERHPGVVADPGAGLTADIDGEAFTGDDSESLETGAESDGTIPAGEFGDTGDFGAPDDVVARTEAALDDVDADQRDVSELSGTTNDHQHLGVSGNFDEADDTLAMPGQMADEDAEPGNEAGASTDDMLASDSVAESTGHSPSGYSAAWSTPAGVLGEWPNQAEGATEPETDESGLVGGQESGSTDAVNAAVDSDADENASFNADASLDGGPETTEGEYLAQDLSGGDGADLAAAGAGDLGAVTTGDSPVQEAPVSRTPSGGGDVPSGAIAGDGTESCPADYPIKGNASSHIYHRPTDSSYTGTIPEYCFATEEDAAAAGFRPPRGHGRARQHAEAETADAQVSADAANIEDAQSPDSTASVEDGDLNANADENASGEVDSAGPGELISQETYRVSPEADGPETRETPDEVPRKSRKQRKAEQSDWLPAGAVRGDGTGVCPADFPIKGNASSRIYHRPTDHSYAPTIPEFCFATEADAKKAGFRAPKG